MSDPNPDRNAGRLDAHRKRLFELEDRIEALEAAMPNPSSSEPEAVQSATGGTPSGNPVDNSLVKKVAEAIWGAIDEQYCGPEDYAPEARAAIEAVADALNEQRNAIYDNDPKYGGKQFNPHMAYGMALVHEWLRSQLEAE